MIHPIARHPLSSLPLRSQEREGESSTDPYGYGIYRNAGDITIMVAKKIA